MLSRLTSSFLAGTVFALAGPASGQAPKAGDLEILATKSFDVGGLEVRGELCRLFVPENRSDPGSRLIELAFGRLHSPAEKPRAPLVYLAGGPGGSATGIARDSAQLAEWRPVIEVCDLILLDQRGTGRSKPPMTWTPEGSGPSDLFTSESAALALALEWSRQAAAHFREQGVDLTGYTTVESADDIDDLRRALGLDKVSLFGFSYGTHLGLATIRRHGGHIECAILAGTEGPDQTFKLPANADTQLRKLAILVARDPVVGPYVPDLVELLERVLARLEAEPLVVTVKDRDSRDVRVPVGKFGLQLILRFDIGDRTDLVVFPRLLYTVERGDPSVLQWFVQKRFSQFGQISAMSMVMDGASGAPPGRWELIRAQARTCLLGNTMNFPYPEVNEPWGTPDLGDEFRTPVVSDVRTLFLSGSLDWNTPPYQAEMARFGFTDAAHIIVDGAGHEQVVTQPEVGRAIVAFLRGEKVSGAFVEAPALRFVPVEGWDPEVTHPSASLGRQLIATMEARGLEAALREHAAIRAGSGADTELAINELGYALLAAGRVPDAIAVFTLNADDHPDSANAWDSLAEAHKAAGDRERAIALYRKSLELNPDNANAKRMLEELGAR